MTGFLRTMRWILAGSVALVVVALGVAVFIAPGTKYLNGTSRTVTPYTAPVACRYGVRWITVYDGHRWLRNVPNAVPAECR